MGKQWLELKGEERILFCPWMRQNAEWEQKVKEVRRKMEWVTGYIDRWLEKRRVVEKRMAEFEERRAEIERRQVERGWW